MSYPANPPPPSGDNSFPAPPPGAPPGPPDQGFGAAPGYHPQQGPPSPGPYPDQGFGPAPHPQEGFGPAPTPPKKSRKGIWTLAALGVILVALVSGGLVFGLVPALTNALSGDKARDAKVGDCIAQLPSVALGEEKEADAKVVDCAAADAAFSVVGRVENQTEQQAKDSTECERYVKEGEEYSVYYSIPTGGTGYLLCLKPKA